MGFMLVAVFAFRSGSRSKGSGKGEVAPSWEIYRNEKIAEIFTKEDGSSKIRKNNFRKIQDCP